MLTPRLLNSCEECSNIPTLIDEIDCKLAQLGGTLYNNVVYMLNKPIPAAAMLDLLVYRRILVYKYVDPDYASPFTVLMIANKVNLLKYKK